MGSPPLSPPSRIRFALQVLRGAGYEAYPVGGCVRDTLLGRTPHDWDIATSALPQTVQRLFAAYRQSASGLKHGTVLVVLEREAVEITTFRIDGAYSDSRRPDHVTFTRKIEDDLARRDFTINACAWGEAGVIDPYGGQEDAKARRIRCVGNAQKRFQEDALRILRAIRFACELDFSIEPATKDALFACGPLLQNISQERKTAEFLRMLTGVRVEKNLQEYREIIALLVPEIRPCFDFDQHNRHHVFDVYTHTLKAVEAAQPDPVVRTALFFHDLAKPLCYTVDARGTGHFYGHPERSAQITQAALARMRFSGADVRAVTELVRHHDTTIPPVRKSVRRWLSALGETQLRRLFCVKRADASAQSPAFLDARLREIRAAEDVLQDLLAQAPCAALSDLAVNGDDLKRCGIAEGPQIGRILQTLLNLVLDEKIENSKDALLARAAELAAKDEKPRPRL